MHLEIHSKKVLDSVREGKKQGPLQQVVGDDGVERVVQGEGCPVMKSLVHMVCKESQSREHRV